MSRLMKFALGLAFWLAFTNHASYGSTKQPEAGQPFEIVRSMEALQDQIVLGNAAAKRTLPQLIRQLAERLLAVSADAWRDPRNARAAIIYTLSGGSPRVLRKAIEIGLSPALDLELMRGIAAYAGGRHEEARNILSQFDALEFTPVIGGHIAMAQAALAAEENPGQAMNLLDKARLMMPGTLIEDAALRRGLILAEKLLDTGKFEALAREYIWRFPRSDYFESFRRQSSSAVTRFILDGEAGDFERIEKLVDLIDPANQCGFYLQTAYQGIIDGKIAAAHRAAIKGRKLARDGTVEQGRAALYNAAALILMGNIETGTNELALANTVQLPRQDEDLKEQVELLISQIGDPAEDPFITSNQVGTAGSHDGTSAAGQAAGLIDLAQKKLAQAVDVIQGKDP